jgi:RecA/RadA recombinase
MASATLTRLESLLAARRLDSTIARKDADAAATLVSTGITSLDTSLGGGWRRGEISEILGVASSGRASVLCATLAAATARGELVALVDTFDRVDPVTAAATGLDLSRVLWVRGPSLTPTAAVSRRDSIVGPAVLRAVRACDLIIRAGGFGIVALDLAGAPARALRELAASTWMRIAHANAGQQTVCLLVGEQPMGRSAAGAATARRAEGSRASRFKRISSKRAGSPRRRLRGRSGRRDSSSSRIAHEG